MSAAEQITYIGLRIQSREELIEYLARVQKAFAFENVLEPGKMSDEDMAVWKNLGIAKIRSDHELERIYCAIEKCMPRSVEEAFGVDLGLWKPEYMVYVYQVSSQAIQDLSPPGFEVMGLNQMRIEFLRLRDRLVSQSPHTVAALHVSFRAWFGEESKLTGNTTLVSIRAHPDATN